jgi:hypothetical protein
MSIIISVIAFFVIFLGLCMVIWFKRMVNARKMIQEDAEVKGWKVIKIKLGWWDFILTYLDEAGIQNKTHYGSYLNKIVWRGETKGLQLEEVVYKAKSKSWLVTSVIFGICFLVLFVGYGYDQIAWNLYRFSFAENGYAVRMNRRFAVGVDSIIRGEEALRLIQSAKPTQDPPGEGKEFLILNLKVKNISRKAPTSCNIRVNVITKSKDFFGDSSHDLYLDLPAIGNFPKLEDTKKLAFGETRTASFALEVTAKAPIQKISISAFNNASYEHPEIPFTRNPFRSSNVVMQSYFLILISLINSIFSNRWHLLLKSKETKKYIFVPLSLLTILFFNTWISPTRDYLLIFVMLLFFTIAWSNIILLTTTNRGKEKI